MVELESALELGFSPRRSKRIRKNRNPLAISPDQSTAATAASKFKSVIATDELLIEILRRLPDARTVIQCSTVCKRWSSLVSSRKFIHRYIQHHRRERASDPSNSPPPYTLLAHSLAVDENKYGCPFYKLFSEESKILHGIDHHRPGVTRDYLGFLPWPRMMIKASFDDLLLVSSLPSFPIPEAYYVCNPVTKQWLVLPETNLRPVYYERCGLVCKKRTDDQYKFKVVILSQYSLAKPVFNATVFCSETGQWSLNTLATPSALTLDGYDFDNAFTVNGVPHFKLYTKSGELVGMVAFDPFKSENSTTGQGRCLAKILEFALVVEANGYNIPAVIVFGDSSVDSGNNNYIPTIARSNFKPYGRDFFGGCPTGRFSNGRLPTDFVSEALGLKPIVPAYLDPGYKISDFAVGVCFASAGTGYDNVTSGLFGVIPLWKEVEYYKEYQNKLRAYLGNEKANKIISEALYLVSIGTNDFLENYFTLPQRQKQFTVLQYEDFIIGLAEKFVEDIYYLGARKISLAGLPPMGCLPLQRFTNILGHHACAEDKNRLAWEYNAKLTRAIAKLNNKLPGIKLVYADAYGIFLDIITRPSQYGFEEAGKGCCGTGRFEMGVLCDPKNPFTCPDANKYVFWDAFHPSERTNPIISNHLIKINLAKIL